MTYDPSNLPAPPEFPASNASYNSIVGKMHKAALCATTAAAAVNAVTLISAHVKGVNTYSKKTRKYGEELVAAITGAPVSAAPHVAEGVKQATAKKTAVEKAAAEGDPVAGFMLAGAKAQATVDKVLIDEKHPPKPYSNKSNAKRALKSAGCDHLPVEWVPVPDPEGYVLPVLIVKDAKGAGYVCERGFTAKVAA